MIGKLLDRDYRLTAKENRFEINNKSGDDLSNFPIEMARLRSVWYPVTINIIAIIGYGWSLKAKSVSSPIQPHRLEETHSNSISQFL